MTDIRKETFHKTTFFPGQKDFNLGFWLLMFSLSVITLSKTRWHINSEYIAAPLLVTGMFYLLMASIQDMQNRTRHLSGIAKLVFGYLLLWGLVTVLRGCVSYEFSTIRALRDNFGMRYSAWTWFVPALMLLSMEPRFLPQLLKTILKHGKLGLIILAVAWLPPLRIFSSFKLLWGCSALLIFWHYLPKGGKLIALTGAFLQVFFVVLASSRNEILGHGFLILSASYIGMMRKYRFRGRRRLGIIACFLVIFSLVYYAANHDNFFFIGEKKEARINAFKEEIFENTRTGYADGGSLYSDFLRDMDKVDLIFGRGSLGTYRSMASGGLSRVNFECGYFHVILKGGGIMLLLMLLLAIPAVLKGFFTSRNWVVKGFAFIVLGWLLEMLPFGLPGAYPRYVLFWLSIGVCLNTKLLKMTNEEIERYLPEGGVRF